jgi:hypothetical protein
MLVDVFDQKAKLRPLHERKQRRGRMHAKRPRGLSWQAGGTPTPQRRF